MLVEFCHGDAGRRPLDDEQRNAAAALGGGIGARGDDQDVAIDRIGDEHFRAVDHPGIAVAAGPRLQPGDVGARIGLGHRDRADRLAADDRGQIFLLLLGRAAQGDVDRRHVGMNQHRRGEAAEGRASEFLRPHHRRQRAHIGAAIFGRVAHAEKAERAHAAVDLARDLAVALPLLAMRHDFLLDKAADLLAQHPQFLGQLRLLREMEFAVGVTARIGGPDVHDDALSALM